jgi:hypothetical protein
LNDPVEREHRIVLLCSDNVDPGQHIDSHQYAEHGRSGKENED